MAVKDYKKINTQDPGLRKVQENIQEALIPIIRAPIIDGVLIEDVQLFANKINEVNHGLGRRAQGFVVVRKRARATVWDEQDFNTTPGKTMSLCCDVNVKIDVWIF